MFISTLEQARSIFFESGGGAADLSEILTNKTTIFFSIPESNYPLGEGVRTTYNFCF